MEQDRLHATLEWLAQTAAEITPRQNLEDALDDYLQRLLAWIGADQGSIMVREGDGLTVLASRGLGEGIRPGVRVALESGPAGEVVSEGRPRLIHGTLSAPRDTRPGSAILIPIRVENSVKGVLNLGRGRAVDAFSPDDVHVSSIAAAQVGWILANFDLASRMWRFAITDELTGLYNRRYFLLRLEEELERSHRYGKPLSLVMLDLDGFQAVNKVHGRETGDAILVESARVIRRAVRGIDLAARYGGDEIIVMLPETTAAAALSLITRLQGALGEEVFPGANEKPVKVTLCAGVARFPRDGSTAEELLRKADLALLDAKRSGGGRVLLPD